MNIKPAQPVTLFWHRRDLRTEDNHGLYKALAEGGNVLPLFIFDSKILRRLERKDDRRLNFIHGIIQQLSAEYEKLGAGFLVRFGNPEEVFAQLIQELNVKSVYTNTDYEPYAKKRDESVNELLSKQNISFLQCKDQVIFEKTEVVKDDGKPYTVYTPYMKKWKQKFSLEHCREYPVSELKEQFYKAVPEPVPSLKEIGFEKVNFIFPDSIFDVETISQYQLNRDFPAKNATSHLGIHLRFGTISIRGLVKFAFKHNEIFLNELIWREFFMMILFHFPHTVFKAFKPAYDNIVWRNNKKEFKQWCEGKTGYPLVDAGMRELAATGFMHNRVRMVTASFLVKHLLIDWRWGEAWFAQHLLDYELSSNIGNWQWAAGCGCDAAPYFRVFNPVTQAKKFDSEEEYIRKWVPEYKTKKYPAPVVDHAFARKRVLNVYKSALGIQKPSDQTSMFEED